MAEHLKGGGARLSGREHKSTVMLDPIYEATYQRVNGHASSRHRKMLALLEPQRL